MRRDATAGDPSSGLKWTHKSLRAVEGELARRGDAVSAPTISRLLPVRKYSLRVNHTRLAGKPSPGREEQFRDIARQRKAFLRHGRPVIRVDAKKKELIGQFKNPGRHSGAVRRTKSSCMTFPVRQSGKPFPMAFPMSDGIQGTWWSACPLTPPSSRSGHSLMVGQRGMQGGLPSHAGID